MNRQNATDYDGNQGHSLTKHEALRAELADQRAACQHDITMLQAKIEHYQEQLYQARQELNQLPSYDQEEGLSFQELASLVETLGVIVPDELMADDEQDDGTGRSCDPYCSCSACIEDLQRRLCEAPGKAIGQGCTCGQPHSADEAGQAALATLVGIVSILVFAALVFALLAYATGPVFTSPW